MYTHAVVRIVNAFLPRCRTIARPLACLLPSWVAPAAHAQAIYFNELNDTVMLIGDAPLGNTATYEAVILLTLPLSPGSSVWQEHKAFEEDKALYFWTNGIQANTFSIGSPNFIRALLPISACQWHHVAFVQSPTSQSLYLDGQLVGVREAFGNLQDATSASGAVSGLGAVRRTNGVIDQAFFGLMDSFRLSNVARYTSNFDPPIGDLTSDANTLLLFNFNEGPGATTVIDSSGNTQHGQITPWFPGATAPQLCPPPIVCEQPMPATICPGDPLSLSVLAVAAAPLTYQWRRNGMPIDTLVNPSASTQTLTIAAVSASDYGSYDCVITGSLDCPITTSAAAVVAEATGCCPADTNNDGMLAPNDFASWIQAFNAQTPACDQNGDGQCLPNDFSAWIANYNAGCP